MVTLNNRALPNIVYAGSLSPQASKLTGDDPSLHQTLPVCRSRARTSPYHLHTSTPLISPLIQKILLASVTLLPTVPSPHFNLRTGALFGDGGVENEYHALPIDVHDRPLAMPHATGSVIMSKLGNETAKCVHFSVPHAETC